MKNTYLPVFKKPRRMIDNTFCCEEGQVFESTAVSAVKQPAVFNESLWEHLLIVYVGCKDRDFFEDLVQTLFKQDTETVQAPEAIL